MTDTATTQPVKKDFQNAPALNSAWVQTAGRVLGPTLSRFIRLPSTLMIEAAQDGSPLWVQFWTAAEKATGLTKYDTLGAAAQSAYEKGHRDLARDMITSFPEFQSNLAVLWPDIVDRNDLEGARKNLAAGADVTSGSMGPQTPKSLLVLALAKNTIEDRKDMIKFALDNGAKADYGTMSSYAAVLRKRDCDPARVLSDLKLIDELGRKQGIDYFTKNNTAWVISQLISGAGEDQDAKRNMSGVVAYLLDRTPINHEITNNYYGLKDSPAVVNLMLERDFLNQKEKQTILHDAILWKKPGLIQILIDNGTKGDVAQMKEAYDVMLQYAGPQYERTIRAIEKQVLVPAVIPGTRQPAPAM